METIFDQTPYKIILQHKPDSQSVDLLKNTLWGTKETVYQHLDTEEHVAKVPHPFFFDLDKNGERIGTCCFSKRTANGQNYDFWYSRYFAVDAKRQGGVFGYMILKHIRKYFEQTVQQPSVFYAYVDASNIRSHKLVTHTGFKRIRSFETLTFSRLYPKKDKRVTLLATEEKEHMIDLLQQAYKDYLFCNFDPSFFDEKYFILKEENEILAGIRVHKARWVIKRLAGWSGALIIKLLPHIPVLSRLFNPEPFTFAAFDGVYCKTGCEKEFFSLMESVCESLNVSTGIMWLDSGSDLYHRLKGAGNWGIMDKLKENIPADVVAAFKNIPEEMQEKIVKHPAYISVPDII
jgi:hypothetical protein